MSGIDRRADGDGPVPEHPQAVVEELRAQGPLTPRRREALIRDFMASRAFEDGDHEGDDDVDVDAQPLSPRSSSPSTPVEEVGPTARSPIFAPPPPPPAGDGHAHARAAGPRPTVVVAGAEPPLPKVVRAPPALRVTAPAPARTAEEWARAGRLPFLSPRDAPKPAARTQKVPVYPPKGHVETTPLGENEITRAVRAILPFVAAFGAAPAMSVEQYACLRAAVELAPASANEIWTQHGVPAIEDRIRIARYWEGEIGRSAALRAWVEAAKAEWKERWRKGG